MFRLSYFLLFFVLAISAFTDITHGRILNIVVLPSSLIFLILRLISSDSLTDVLMSLFSLCFPAALLMPFWVAGRRSCGHPRFYGLGAGDIKLLTTVSLAMAPGRFLICSFLSFSLGAIFGVILCLKTHQLSSRVPLAPFIFAGCLLSFSGGYGL